MPTPAQRRRASIARNEQTVRGKIWALEDDTAIELFTAFTRSRDEMLASLQRTWNQHVDGDTWSISDTGAKARTRSLLRQIDAESKRLINESRAVALQASIGGYQAGYAGRAWVLDQGLRSGDDVEVALLPVRAIRIAILRPFEGKTFVGRFTDARADFTRLIRRSIAESQIQGESIFKAQQRIADALGIPIGRRTKAARVANRAMFARTEMIARTEILRSSNLAAIQVYEDNSDVLAGWQWLLTQDERTCQICIAENQNDKVFKFGEKSPPPAHPRCRCTPIPALMNASLNAPIEAGTVTGLEDWVKSVEELSDSLDVLSKRSAPPPVSLSPEAEEAAPELL